MDASMWIRRWWRPIVHCSQPVGRLIPSRLRPPPPPPPCSGVTNTPRGGVVSCSQVTILGIPFRSQRTISAHPSPLGIGVLSSRYSLYASKHHAGHASARRVTDGRQQMQCPWTRICHARGATMKTRVSHLGEFDEWTTHDGGSTIALKRQNACLR